MVGNGAKIGKAAVVIKAAFAVRAKRTIRGGAVVVIGTTAGKLSMHTSLASCMFQPGSVHSGSTGQAAGTQVRLATEALRIAVEIIYQPRLGLCASS